MVILSQSPVTSHQSPIIKFLINRVTLNNIQDHLWEFLITYVDY
ncbi:MULTISPECIES: hypothetical protein [Sphaerospermopsis]|nr:MULTISPECIES: hypothetical protein [Sphaerospermopsis]